MLRPVQIEFPAYGLPPQKQGLFAAHLNEQQIGLNYLSLQRTDDLLTNLANYPNIADELKAARALGRANIDGSGVGLDAAHRLDTVAGAICIISPLPRPDSATHWVSVANPG